MLECSKIQEEDMKRDSLVMHTLNSRELKKKFLTNFAKFHLTVDIGKKIISNFPLFASENGEK